VFVVVSFELLGVIVRESLGKYECVPLRDLLREYNARCVLGGRVRCLIGPGCFGVLFVMRI
jgi:hypothetical protein